VDWKNSIVSVCEVVPCSVVVSHCDGVPKLTQAHSMALKDTPFCSTVGIGRTESIAASAAPPAPACSTGCRWYCAWQSHKDEKRVNVEEHTCCTGRGFCPPTPPGLAATGKTPRRGIPARHSGVGQWRAAPVPEYLVRKGMGFGHMHTHTPSLCFARVFSCVGILRRAKTS